MSIDFSQEETQQPLLSTAHLGEDEGELSLRPRKLTEYIGQEKAKENLSIFIDAAKLRGSLWTMCCSTAPQAWARRRSPASSPTRWASTCG